MKIIFSLVLILLGSLIIVSPILADEKQKENPDKVIKQCEIDCIDLQKRGELRKGMSLEECAKIVCEGKKSKVFIRPEMTTTMEVKEPKDAIRYTADISSFYSTGDISMDRDYIFLADSTYANVTRRIDEKTIELGVGTKLEVALFIPIGSSKFVDKAGGNKKIALLGHPGSTITLQPGASLVWRGMELSPMGRTPVTFRIGLEKDEPVISEIVSGNLTFTERDSQVRGILKQTEKGIVQKVIDSSR